MGRGCCKKSAGMKCKTSKAAIKQQLGQKDNTTQNNQAEKTIEQNDNTNNQTDSNAT